MVVASLVHRGSAVALPAPPLSRVGAPWRRRCPYHGHRRLTSSSSSSSLVVRAGGEGGRSNGGAGAADKFNGEIVDPDLIASYNPALDREVRPEGDGDEEDEGFVDYYNDMPLDGTAADGERLEPLTLEELAELGEEGRAMGLDKVGAFGDEAVLVAGFALHELPMLQAVLDARQREGSPLIRLVPVSDDNIWRSVKEVLADKEVPWNLLYGRRGLRCSGWGKERVALFSGLTLQSQATLLELIDSLGLGRVTPGQLDEGDQDLAVGEALVVAVTEYRKALQRKKDGFDLKEDFRRHQEEEEAKSKPVYDLKSDDPDNLGNAINADGTLDPSFIDGVVEKAKAQMTKRLQEEDLDPAELRNMSLHIGAPEVGESEDAGPERVDLRAEQRRAMATEGARGAQSVERQGGNGKDAEQEMDDLKKFQEWDKQKKQVDAEVGDDSDRRQAALLAVQEAFKMALRDGMSVEEVEAIIDRSCGEGSGAAVASEHSPGSTAAQLEMEALLQQLASVEEEEEVVKETSREEARSVAEKEEEEEGGGAEVMTLAQLRETAERHGLDYEKLVQDAEAKGIQLK